MAPTHMDKRKEDPTRNLQDWYQNTRDHSCKSRYKPFNRDQHLRKEKPTYQKDDHQPAAGKHHRHHHKHVLKVPLWVTAQVEHQVWLLFIVSSTRTL